MATSGKKRVKTGSGQRGAGKVGPVAVDRGITEGRSFPGKLLSEDEKVTEASVESFPASDPPSYMGNERAGTPRR